MADTGTDVPAQQETAIRAHDVDDNGDCVAGRRGGLAVEYPSDVRLLAELHADALAGSRSPAS